MKKTYLIRLKNTNEYLYKTRNGRWFKMVTSPNIESYFVISGLEYVLAEYSRRDKANARLEKLNGNFYCTDEEGNTFLCDDDDFEIVLKENKETAESEMKEAYDALKDLYVKSERGVECDEELADVCKDYLILKKYLDELKGIK